MLFADENWGILSQLPEDPYSPFLETSLPFLSNSSPALGSAPLQKPGFPQGLGIPFTTVGKPPTITAGDSLWPDVCHEPPRAPCSRASVLPRAGLADPHRRTARPAASCPWAGCRCRRWAQSISSASGCEQAAGHPIRRDWICCVALQCCISGHLRTPVPRSGQGQAARCSRGEGRATQSSVITAAAAH